MENIDTETLWKKIINGIKEENQIPPHSFKIWIEPLELKKDEDNIYTLCFPNSFSLKRFKDQSADQSKYVSIIKSQIEFVLSHECTLILKESDQEKLNTKPKRQTKINSSTNATKPILNNVVIRKDFTFENFVEGPNNKYAHRTLLALMSKENDENIFLLLAKTGMGKSHLCQAVANEVLHKQDRLIRYTTAESFSNEMVTALYSNMIADFRKKYKDSDIFILEDIHRLSNKSRTQIELIDIIKALLDANKKMILSTCYPPNDIPDLSNEMESLFHSSDILEIDPPNFETRMAILKKKMDLYKCENMPENVLNYLASELTSDIRQLESGLKTLTHKSSMLGVPIDIELANKVVKNIVDIKSITIDSIKRIVCESFSIPTASIISKSRQQKYVRARNLSFYLCRTYTNATTKEMCKAFNRTKQIVLRGIDDIEKQLPSSPEIERQIDILLKKIETQKTK